MVTTSEVYAGNLEESSVNISLVESYSAVDGYFLIRATTHGIVLALNQGVAITVGEGDRAIFGVING